MGAIFTAIMVRWEGQNDSERTQQFDVFRKIVPLWKKGEAYPPPDEHVLKIPFAVTLPADLPPSYKHSQSPGIGVVEYVIQVIGTRGKSIKKKIQCPIPVLPVYPQGVHLRETLRLGWTGEWKDHEFSQKIRKGLWGDYATVSAVVTLPGTKQIPTHTSIPVTVTVTTLSKPMKWTAEAETEPVFPVPPSTTEGVELRLVRFIAIEAQGYHRYGDIKVSSLAGLGPTAPAKERAGVEVGAVSKVWVPKDADEKSEKKKKHGWWKQEVQFKSQFTLATVPAFQSPFLRIAYRIDVTVSFAGVGNDLKGQIPLAVVSSMSPSGQWDGPPPEIDLPPSYFTAMRKDGDVSESSSS